MKKIILLLFISLARNCQHYQCSDFPSIQCDRQGYAFHDATAEKKELFFSIRTKQRIIGSWLKALRFKLPLDLMKIIYEYVGQHLLDSTSLGKDKELHNMQLHSDSYLIVHIGQTFPKDIYYYNVFEVYNQEGKLSKRLFFKNSLEQEKHCKNSLEKKNFWQWEEVGLVSHDKSIRYYNYSESFVPVRDEDIKNSFQFKLHLSLFSFENKEIFFIVSKKHIMIFNKGIHSKAKHIQILGNPCRLAHLSQKFLLVSTSNQKRFFITSNNPNNHIVRQYDKNNKGKFTYTQSLYRRSILELIPSMREGEMFYYKAAMRRSLGTEINISNLYDKTFFIDIRRHFTFPINIKAFEISRTTNRLFGILESIGFNNRANKVKKVFMLDINNNYSSLFTFNNIIHHSNDLLLPLPNRQIGVIVNNNTDCSNTLLTWHENDYRKTKQNLSQSGEVTKALSFSSTIGTLLCCLVKQGHTMHLQTYQL